MSTNGPARVRNKPPGCDLQQVPHGKAISPRVEHQRIYLSVRVCGRQGHYVLWHPHAHGVVHRGLMLHHQHALCLLAPQQPHQVPYAARGERRVRPARNLDMLMAQPLHRRKGGEGRGI